MPTPSCRRGHARCYQFRDRTRSEVAAELLDEADILPTKPTLPSKQPFRLTLDVNNNIIYTPYQYGEKT